MRLRRGTAGTALAVVAVAALTASQAPGVVGAGDARAPWDAHRAPAPTGAADDGSYHTELPPLDGASGRLAARASSIATVAASGIPATVLRAYQQAEKSLASTTPGCGLPWELLAAIGKVESGQARGGDVRSDGTTRRPILGPVLDGNGFARITDTDGGALDGNDAFDRAVGPLQFIPSTWRAWASDGNRDGRKDPHNIHDAALAAGRYLCADGRDLTRAPGLRRAILSYNHSDAYLRTVLAWLRFYREGTHAVPDGEGVLPAGGSSGKRTGGEKGDKKGGGRAAEKERGKNAGSRPGSGSDHEGDAPGPGRPGPRPSHPDPSESGDPTEPPPCGGDTESPTP
ncbi:lytic transglycosylase domain-containing protein, partial [Streptomyces sp. PU-14G]|uniref:lytic transglycosylase domain-containing protein n=1 Tax=Streptomyces sp. PU-14G TaxID=2800808 RepID=UPI0034DDF14E